MIFFNDSSEWLIIRDNRSFNGPRSITERYSFISKQIDQNLKIDNPGILLINEEHKVQFSDDIQVFYVSPPSVDKFKKWREKYIVEMREKFSPTNTNEINEENESDS